MQPLKRITVKEAANKIGYNAVTFARMLNEGLIPDLKYQAVKNENSKYTTYIIYESDIEAYLRYHNAFADEGIPG